MIINKFKLFSRIRINIDSIVFIFIPVQKILKSITHTLHIKIDLNNINHIIYSLLPNYFYFLVGIYPIKM